MNADQTPLLSTCRDIRAVAERRGGSIDFFNGMAMFGTGGYRAKLGDGSFRELLPAGSWWSHIVYVVDPHTWLSRRDIVLNVADKDGGAHVDARLTAEYEVLIRPGSLGVLVAESSGEAVEWPIADGHFLALRQMAYELLNSEALIALAA
jgi:hypothetical protein